MEREIRAAQMVRENRSRLSLSLPNRNTAPGDSTPNSRTRVGNSPSRRYSAPAVKKRSGYRTLRSSV